MTVGVHGHKAGVLQETGVHAASGTRKVVGHPEDHIVLKPLVAAVRCQVVHRGGRSACIDGAAHHGHGDGRGLAAAGHQRHRSQHRHGGLADADHMAIAINALQVANELLYIVDVVVKVKLALGQRHQAGAAPVGDVDLVVLEHGAHGVAQQGGVMAGQRGYDQHHGLGFELGQRGRVVRKTLETAQFAKRLVDFDTLMDGHANAVHIDRGDVKFWFFVALAQAIQQVVAGRNTLRERDLAQGRRRVAVQLRGGLGKVGKGLHQGALGFVYLVEHGVKLRYVAVQYNSNWLRMSGVKPPI